MVGPELQTDAAELGHRRAVCVLYVQDNITADTNIALLTGCGVYFNNSIGFSDIA
jgi:hypothetical protein